MRVKFLTLDNADGTRTLKQHAFKPKAFTDKWSLESYEGNIALCSKYWASDDGERPVKFDEMEAEKRSESNICKKCLMILNNM